MKEVDEKLLKPYDPHQTESRIYKKWEENGHFKPQGKGEPYTVTIAPPNITGSLHMGHALENTISDILVRFHRMKGFKTLWIPGTDHAGIATQNVVEKALKKEGLSRHDLGREKFLEKVWEWKDEHGNIILDQLKKLGCSLDWSRTRFTMDEEYQEAVQTAFKHYKDKELIYQGERVINWCIKDQTALSDLEIEYKEEKSSLWFIRYPISKPDTLDPIPYITVATTRPETMLGDAAVAVHPEDSRYKNLIGQKVILPILNREIPIVGDLQIDKEFGTGAVKITPAHDIFDSEVAERHSLPYFKVIDEVGKIANVAEEFDGLKIKAAREKVIEKLKELDLLEKEEEITHNVAKCYRCDSTVEPLLSKQWFIKMKSLAEKAIDSIEKGGVKYHPEKWSKIALEWLKNSKDWCISRQIWWGHKIPIEESDDVFDTWFSSALWPFATLGWPKETDNLKEFYPAQVVTSARDIIHLWISRMIFSGLEFMEKPPFENVVIHATVLTKDGKRMSKSLGTGIDPLLLIEKYGADALRFGLIWQAMGGQDIRFSEDHIAAGKKFCNKLWNITRFILTKTENEISDSKPDLSGIAKDSEEVEILKKLESCQNEVSELLGNYKFGDAMHVLYEFIWKEFADKFIEYSKQSDSKETKQTLSFCLVQIIKTLHPFTPFVTEEIWSTLPDRENLLIVENW